MRVADHRTIVGMQVIGNGARGKIDHLFGKQPFDVDPVPTGVKCDAVARETDRKRLWILIHNGRIATASGDFANLAKPVIPRLERAGFDAAEVDVRTAPQSGFFSGNCAIHQAVGEISARPVEASHHQHTFCRRNGFGIGRIENGVGDVTGALNRLAKLRQQRQLAVYGCLITTQLGRGASRSLQ